MLHHARRGRLPLIHQSRHTILLEVSSRSLVLELAHQRGFADSPLSPERKDVVRRFFGFEDLLHKKEQFFRTTNKRGIDGYRGHNTYGLVFLHERHRIPSCMFINTSIGSNALQIFLSLPTQPSPCILSQKMRSQKSNGATLTQC